MTTGADRRVRWAMWWRTHRKRLDDLGLFLIVACAAAVDVLDAANNDRLTATAWTGAVLTVAVAVGLWWRRRAPLLLTTAACAAVVLGASQVLLSATLLTVATRRRDRALAVATGAGVAAKLVAAWRLDPSAPAREWITGGAFLAAVFVGLPVAAGAFVGARRDLLASLRERAERAEAEQRFRTDQARLAERTRIAQEMHDVLGHRISLVALHAGGLEVSTSSAEVARSAALIRATARQALDDLRDVLGVLRGGHAELSTQTTRASVGEPANLLPQPSLGDLADLVRTNTEAGGHVRLVEDLESGVTVPPLIGRTAYRVVQEALTNVHKHAAGAATTVHVAGVRGDHLMVEVVNARPVALQGAAVAPGSGLGLVGLRERVSLVHGQLRAATEADGGFAVRALLPWSEPDDPDD